MADQTKRDVAYRPGGYTLEQCDILQANGNIALDVRNQIDGIALYEDMFSPFITGRITFRDTFDLPSVFGRQGRNLLALKISTPTLEKQKGNVISGYFFIYKMGERELVRDRAQMYNLYFISIEGLVDSQTQISQMFQGTADTIVGNIFTKYIYNSENNLPNKKQINTDAATESIKYVSNLWTPTKNMNFLSAHAHTNDSASYLFFENRDGFQFRTLESLAAGDPAWMFMTSDFSVPVSGTDSDVPKASAPGSSIHNPAYDYMVIQGSYRIRSFYDYMRDFSMGSLATQMTTYDIVRKKIDYQQYKVASKGILNLRSLYADDIISATSNLRMAQMKHYDSAGTNQGMNGNTTNSGWIQQRISELGMLNSSKIEIDVFGRTDYTVGKKYELHINATSPVDKNTDPKYSQDLNYSGNYLSTAISHQFTRSSYMCTIELSKESTNNT